LQPIDWCLLVAGKSKPNILIKISLEVMKKISPEFIHSCPYVGLHKLSNFSTPRQFLAFYASGVYKQKISLFDGQDKMFVSEGVYTIS
jgi:hypothetical protein